MSKTGTEPQYQRLQLCEDSPERNVIAELSDGSQTLAAAGAADKLILHMIDTNPASIVGDVSSCSNVSRARVTPCNAVWPPLPPPLLAAGGRVSSGEGDDIG